MPNVWSSKARVGYVPEEAHLYSFLSGREHLDSSVACVDSPVQILTYKNLHAPDLFGLDQRRRSANQCVSMGMKQKVLLIAALLHDPDCSFLDEPESGLISRLVSCCSLIPILAARGKMIV